ncbi:helix-turn-helix transcriptional regulator [Subtercola endophyticus]|uniref:helix-turn-helix transcriptional regulator n=1 Tax=Subtercola endophyticus TaxID=2895559 RepID=UPI001E65C528|nr:helix-turn-helix transcriptional regulator [Subtercola endophyticus]UFS59427.1 helix-turn-helix transcriptional regulator [Subtercola endophyticus]
MTPNVIGDYLRARREQVRPEDVGLVDNGRRRVPGLRRDELAMLAGISTEYYTRLEQGRDQHPSTQVLEAVARALHLDDDARAHLHLLASPRPGTSRATRRTERVRPSVQQLLDSWTETPAYVHGPLLDVIASNALARALSRMFEPGMNVLRSTFLDPAVHELLPDWETKVVTLVAALRAMVGFDVEDVRLTELVGELSVKSSAFARLWSRHDVRPQSGGGLHVMHHHSVGELQLTYDKFEVAGSDGQTLVIYHADAGSGTAQALRLLSTLAADAAVPTIPEDRPVIQRQDPR